MSLKKGWFALDRTFVSPPHSPGGLRMRAETSTTRSPSFKGSLQSVMGGHRNVPIHPNRDLSRDQDRSGSDAHVMGACTPFIRRRPMSAPLRPAIGGTSGGGFCDYLCAVDWNVLYYCHSPTHTTLFSHQTYEKNASNEVEGLYAH